MKNLLPIVVVLIILMAFVSVLPAQTKIHNPDLPKGLVFQWQIHCESVHHNWKNEDFTINRGANGLVVFYGTYRSLATAMENLPSLPEGIERGDVSLIPFFNQTSITAADAFILAGNRNWLEMNGQTVEEAVSFTVYFDTYETPVSTNSFSNAIQELSFEIQPNRTFAYSAGRFKTETEAEAYKSELHALGYERAEVNKYLNGEKIAMSEVMELYAFAALQL